MTVSNSPTPKTDELHTQGFLTMSEAQEQLGVAKITVNRMVADGRLRSERAGRRRVTRPEWVSAAASAVGGAGIEGFVTAPEAAQETGVPVGAVYRAIHAGRLPAQLIAKPRSYRIAREDLDNWTPQGRTAAEWRREHGLLTAAEAAAALGISRQAMNLRIHSGGQPAEKAPEDSPMPGVWVIREQDVLHTDSAGLLTVAEAAAQVDRTPETIRRAIRNGRLPATRLPFRQRFHAITQEDLDRWARNRRPYRKAA